ncbi:hypothetical protein B0J17DRAFT_667720 [Rhizoctonia solani]|nr:hypothetical protein B0J17DRAFT_667720 [Rhizoctonia solani]
MIIPDSEKSESSARSTSARSRTSFGPVDDPPSPPPYSPTITSSHDHYQDGRHSPQPTNFYSASSTQPNLPPRCNYLIDRKNLSSLSGTWHIDTALEIPERLLAPITEFDGRWNREIQQARKARADELRRRQGRMSDSTRAPLAPFVETRPNLMLGATNGAINGDIHVVSGDGLVRQTTLVAEGCNGSISLKIHALSHQLLRVFASSTNGSVSIKIPSSFEGAVVMSTSWGSVNISDAIKAKLTTFSHSSNKSQSFIGDWQAKGFGSTTSSTDPLDDPPLPGPQDPFAIWTGPLIDISSTNGCVSLSFIEEDAASAFTGHFTKAFQGFMDGWFGRGGNANGGAPNPPSPMFNPACPPTFHPPPPPMFHVPPPSIFHPPPPGAWPTHSRSPLSGVGVLDLD